MREESWMPRYRCTECGKDWALGGKMRRCPRCGRHGPHDCCRLGWDGAVSTLRVLPARESVADGTETKEERNGH